MKFKKIIGTVLSMSIILNSVGAVNVCAAKNELVAFPGAEGGGMYTKGARAANNFEIYHVTNLNDSGEGSFRDAVSQSNRIIVFDIAGTILLEDKIIIKSNNLTILGQTAPGEGVCIGGDSVQFEYCDNIIIRYLRFRSSEGSYEDSLGGKGCSNVIIDHCSLSWSVDELLSWYGNTNFTAQWNIISEALRNSTHDKGTHGYGGLWGGTNASFHHNLLANNESRNPRIGSTETLRASVPDTEALIDVRNNVIYSWSKNAGYGGENGVRVNFVNNYFKPTDIAIVHTFYEFYSGRNSCIDGVDSQSTTLHLSGNVMEGMKDLTDDNYKGLDFFSNGQYWWIKRENISEKGVVMHGFEKTDKEVPEVLLPNDQYLSDYPVKTQTAEEAYTDVLKYAGASFRRDTIDERVINNVKNGEYPNGSNGSIGFVDSIYDVGGYCYLYEGEKPADTDADGIPDEWEDKNGLDKDDPTDAVKISSSGYTNIEVYANSLVEKFEEKSVDRSELGLAVSRFMNLEKWKYYENDINNIAEEAEKAKLMLETSQDQAEIDAETEKLNAMTGALKFRYKAILQVLIDETEQTVYTHEPPYSRESMDVLNTALNKAKNDLSENDDDELFKKDTENLQKAIDGLEESIIDEFNTKVENTVAQYITSGKYTKSSTELMQSVIDEANELASRSDYTNAELRAMMDKIDETAKQMVLLDTNSIKNILSYLSGGIFAEEYLTENSKTVLANLKHEAAEIAQNPDGENETSAKFYDKVKNALVNLEYADNYKSMIFTEDFETENDEIKETAEYIKEDGNTYIKPNDVNSKISIPFDKTDDDTYISMDFKFSEEDAGTMLFNYALENNWDIGVGVRYLPESGMTLSVVYDNNKNYMNYDTIPQIPVIIKGWNKAFCNYNGETGVLSVYINNALVYKNEMTQKVGGNKKAVGCEVSAATFWGMVLSTNQKNCVWDNLTLFKLGAENKYIYGDADCDGQITATDASLIMQKTLTENAVLPIENKTSDWMKYIDVDADGNVTASDAAMILQKTLNEKLTMPAEK
ncbi:MAG: hypothetical protein IJ062_00075 [Firmicutes bacterium]|nr:hypothetical protein [Bacillota bacterium]